MVNSHMTKTTQNIYTVSSLTYEIKSLFEQRFAKIRVQGEVSNLKKQLSGHIYFTLKDKSSSISVALFAGYAKSCPPIKDGDEIIIDGEVSVYAPRGSYQIIAKKVSKVGVGDLLLKLHQLKEQLQKQGYFDKSRKKQIPAFPKKIGVVTSGTGAVIKDIINVLSRRYPNFQLVLNPVPVQGKGAEFEIAQAINDFNKHNLVDVLIVGRGGGSLEDLFCFNEKVVADAIYNSEIPIISAVGHETDFTIADFVADVRAPTPSAAAEIAMQEKAKVQERMQKSFSTIEKILQSKIQRLKTHLSKIKQSRFLSSPYSMLGVYIQRIDSISTDIDFAYTSMLHKKRSFLKEKEKMFMSLSPLKKILHEKQQLHRLIEHLQSVNPKNILQKGYSIVLDKEGKKVIKQIKDAKKSTHLTIQLSDGSICASVSEPKE